MQEHEIIRRIESLCHSRGWTYYRLSKESGIPYSTLCTMLHKANAPSIPTLIKICNGFGISLSEFFDLENEAASYTPCQKELLHQWSLLTGSNQEIAQTFIRLALKKE